VTRKGHPQWQWQLGLAVFLSALIVGPVFGWPGMLCLLVGTLIMARFDPR
jgi:hypothetical protein